MRNALHMAGMSTNSEMEQQQDPNEGTVDSKPVGAKKSKVAKSAKEGGSNNAKTKKPTKSIYKQQENAAKTENDIIS